MTHRKAIRGVLALERPVRLPSHLLRARALLVRLTGIAVVMLVAGCAAIHGEARTLTCFGYCTVAFARVDPMGPPVNQDKGTACQHQDTSVQVSSTSIPGRHCPWVQRAEQERQQSWPGN